MSTQTPTAAPPPLIEQDQPGWVVPARVAGLVLALVLIGSGALSVVAQFVTKQGSRSQVITQPVQRLAIDSQTGDVRIRFGTGPQTTVRTVRQFSFGTPVVRQGLTGGTLHLAETCDNRSWLLLPGTCSVDFEVTLPPDVPVTVATQTGDVQVHGSTGAVQVSAETGDLQVLDAASGSVSAHSSTGDIRVQFRSAPHTVSVRTDTGDIRIQVPDDGSTYLVRAGTGTGDLKVDDRLRNGRSASTIQAHADTGDVTVSAG
jgi:hypothetical protein